MAVKRSTQRQTSPRADTRLIKIGFDKIEVGRVALFVDEFCHGGRGGASPNFTAYARRRGLKHNPKGIRFNDLCKICDLYFGEARQKGSSHRVYRTPWIGDPRVNIQNNKGMAKAYQVKQVLKAIERLEEEKNVEK